MVLQPLGTLGGFMAVLVFDTYLDRFRHWLLTFAGDPHLRDHLKRSVVSYRDFKLTSTQLDALNATPIELIPAPGADKAVVVEGVFTKIDAGATAFESGTATLKFCYTNGSGDETATAVPNARVESGTDTYYHSIPAAVIPVVNAKVVAAIGTDISAGDGTIYGRIFYRVVDVNEVGQT